MIRLACIFWLCLTSLESDAQQYLFYFTDKKDTPFDLSQPQDYLSSRALERRQRYDISIDSTDLPVPADYLYRLQKINGLTILNVSRWMNAASVRLTGPAALAAAMQLPFIRSSEVVGANTRQNARSLKPLLGKIRRHKAVSIGVLGMQDNHYDYGRSEQQVAMHKGQVLHNWGLRGDSVVIGMLDAGFLAFNTLPAFDSVQRAGRILGTWDFVSGDTSVAEDNAHGMQCLSIIAANIPGSFVGTAPEASFFLFRSEDDRSEKLIEEFNWVCAAERLDSAGGDVLSSSLGYNTFDAGTGNHTYADMNGDVTLVAKAADLAARKGILVVASAGNSGNDAWKYITTPADGDSVLAVGAVNSSGAPASFSSYGPAADGRVKPNVASIGVGTIIQSTNGTISSGNGTSYACPFIAGLAACLWQGFPERNNMQIIAALQSAGSKADVPDDRIGYGLPDMQKAAGLLLKQYAQASVSLFGCGATISWQSKDVGGMQYVIERKDPANSAFTPVGVQAGTGNVWGTRSYSFTDRLDGISGPVQYRIKQELDTSGTTYYAEYLDTVTVNGNVACSANDRYSILPNPVIDEATLLLHFTELVPVLELQLFNALGQLIWQQKESKPAGFTHLALPAGRLASGKYYLRIASGSNVLATLDFIKL